MLETKEGDTMRLVDFLEERDVPCPFCGYNLCNLTDHDCPECGHRLRLTVGVHDVRFGWFLAAVTPSLVSGVSALSLLVLMMAAIVTGGGPLPPVLFLLVLLGVLSGVVAIVLILRRHRFIQLRPQVQRRWAALAWGLHGVPFVGLLLLLIVTA